MGECMQAGQRLERTGTTQPEGTVLSYGRGMKAFPFVVVIFWLVLFLWIGLAYDLSPADSRSGPYALAGFYFLGIILPWIMFLETFGTRIVLSHAGLQGHSVWRGTRFIGWEDIESIRESSWGRALIVKGHDGKLNLNLTLAGTAIFAEAVNSRVPPEKWVDVSGRLRLLLPKGPYD